MSPNQSQRFDGRLWFVLFILLPFLSKGEQVLLPFWAHLKASMAAPLGEKSRGVKWDVQIATAKAVELRAIHATMLQRKSTGKTKLPSSPSPSLSPISHSSQDYPVFMPRNEDGHSHSHGHGHLPVFHHIHSDSRSRGMENASLLGGRGSGAEAEGKAKLSESKDGLRNGHIHLEFSAVASEDRNSSTDSCVNHNRVPHSSPASVIFSGDEAGSSGFVTTCNACKPATISTDPETDCRKSMNCNSAVASTASQPLGSQSKGREPFLSRLIPNFMKWAKSETSDKSVMKSETKLEGSCKSWALMSPEVAKSKPLTADECRYAEVPEASDMRSSLRELRQKLAGLESYCDELKRALQGRETAVTDGPCIRPRWKSFDSSADVSMPVSSEAMVEGFLQIVSEARLSVKEFCKNMTEQIDEIDAEKLNLHLLPHNLVLDARNSKAVIHHLQALVNQSLHQDFENCVFQRDGSQKLLDPHQDRREKFSSFVALRHLSWKQVLRKGTRYYSEEFGRFCDQRMSCIISILDFSGAWMEQLLQSFFIAAKCVWLLHLLAFSFNPPVVILRVAENRTFDPQYMDDVAFKRQSSEPAGRVKLMVSPGFYIGDHVLRCRVICKHNTLA